MKEEKSDRWFETVGKHFKQFIKEKFPTQRDASAQLGISETALSRLISGARLPSRNLTLKILKLGFDKKYFDEFDSLEEIRPDDLTKKDLIDLLKERRVFAKQQADMIEFLMERLNKTLAREEEYRIALLRIEKKKSPAKVGNSE